MNSSQQTICPVTRSRMSAAPSTLFFNPRDPQFNSNPYKFYKRLREEDPVHRSNLGVWFLGKYDDIRRTMKAPTFSVQDIPGRLKVKSDLLRRKRIASDQPDNLDKLIEQAENWMPFVEGEVHTRLRGSVSVAFERRASNAMRFFIRAAAQSLISEVLRDGRMDVMKDFATILPVRTMAATLGLPQESHERLVAWSNSISRIFDPLLSLAQYGELNRASEEFITFLQGLIPRRRSTPQDDLISALIGAQDKEDTLSDRELISVIIMLFSAGIDTTGTLIGNAALALFEHPERAKQLRENLELMPAAVEELLRYDAPLQMTSRAARADMEIGGKAISKGDQVYVILGSGNRDPERFVNPDDLDWGRERNHHLSFAVGNHMCLGAPLARVMVQEALCTYLEALPKAKPAFDRITYRPHTVLRSPTSIPISF
jgi:cytochrome P450